MSDVPPDRSDARSALRFKRWKKYAFEFIMVFLAVFLGFLAENARENFAEKQQARELAKSFYEELKSDSLAVASKIQGRLKKEHAIEYMIGFFRDSSLTSSSKPLSVNFIWAITARTPIIFTPRTVVLEQLKSSGSLRYFRNKELRDLIGDLSVSIDYIKTRQDYENSIFETYMEPIMTKHMDFNFQSQLFKGEQIFDRLDAYESGSEYIPFHLSQVEKLDRQTLINALGYYHTNGLKSTRLIPFKKYVEVNAATLSELRREFNLE
ncbi:MAG: hypothetical protein JNJ75_12360 [Cyclobacteriaceae bacterium]|nr:hypothetical protein [Cyclobacteriaceae bacterium]